MEIVINDDSQYFYLNTEELAAYPNEQEVLLQDGAEYKVIKKETIKVEGQQVTKVTLEKLKDRFQQMGTFRRNLNLLLNWVSVISIWYLI